MKFSIIILMIIIQVWKLRQKKIGYLAQSRTLPGLKFRPGCLTPQSMLLTTECCTCHAEELRMYPLAVTWLDLCFDEMTQDEFKKGQRVTWPVWLSWLGVILQSQRSLVPFLVRAMPALWAWSPVGVRVRGKRSVFLSLSFSLLSPLSKIIT